MADVGTTESADRDESGRFVKGWRGGPGRPKGIDVRAAFVAAQGQPAAEKAVVDVMLAMLEKALGGDAVAAKVVLERLAGPVVAQLEASVQTENVGLSQDEIERRVASLMATAQARVAAKDAEK